MPDLSLYYFLQAVVSHWNAFREKRKTRDFRGRDLTKTSTTNHDPSSDLQNDA